MRRAPGVLPSRAAVGSAARSCLAGVRHRRRRRTIRSAGATRRPAALTTVKLQLQWFTQAQFAGYYRRRRPGLLQGRGPRRRDPRGRRRHRAADRPGPGHGRLRHRLGAQGAGVARAGRRHHRRRPDLPALRHLQVSFEDKGIRPPADLKGKKVGNWGFGNEFELFAGMTKAGLDPAKDVTLVQQQFDMQALLAGRHRRRPGDDLQRVRAGARGEEPGRPASSTQPADFTIIDWNDVGTAMLQDAIWANTESCQRQGVPGHGGQVPHGDHQGLGLLPGQPGEVPRHRRGQGLEARQQPPAVADERDQQADLAVDRRRRPRRQGRLEPDRRHRPDTKNAERRHGAHQGSPRAWPTPTTTSEGARRS